jgi:hypothetical protein
MLPADIQILPQQAQRNARSKFEEPVKETA